MSDIDYAQGLREAYAIVPSYDQLRMNALQMQQTQAQTQAIQAEAAQRQQAQKDEGAFTQAVSDLGSNPTADRLSALALRFPKYAQTIEAAGKTMTEAHKTATTSDLVQAHAALGAGRVDLARQIFQRHADADSAAGKEADPTDTAVLGMLDSGDPAQIKAARGFILSSLNGVNPDVAKGLVETGQSGTVKGTVVGRAVGHYDDSGTWVTDYRDPEPVAYHEMKSGETLVQTGGGDPASGGGAAGVGDVSRLINSDAGGGYVPAGVKTLGQFVSYGKGLNARGAKSSSAGTYQINGSTMREFGPQALGAGWASAPFNADTQEKVGQAIFDWAKGQPDPAKALRGRWVSLTSDEADRLVKGDWAQARGLIAQKESGGGPGASAAPAPGGARVVFSAPPAAEPEAQLDDATVATMADQYLAGDPSVLTNLGRGKQGAANIVKLRAAITEAAKARGMSGKDIADIMQTFKTHQRGLTAFATGVEARTVRSLNVTIDHLDTLQNAAQALQNGNVRIFNSVRQKIAGATGSAAPTNFEGVKRIVSAEVAKAIVGGQTALADRHDLADAISAANSPQQLAGYVAEVKKLLGGQLQGLAYQYKSATGRDDFADRLSERTKHALGMSRPPAGGFRIKRIIAATRK